jgi:hypothetical protein
MCKIRSSIRWGSRGITDGMDEINSSCGGGGQGRETGEREKFQEVVQHSQGVGLRSRVDRFNITFFLCLRMG